jgi:hypothetical protein
MNARIVALATVLEVLVLMGLGLGLFFAPLSLIWAFDDGFSTDLLFSWAAAVDLWMLGHGVPLFFSLPVDLADSLALGSLSREFVVDVALLGVGLLTVMWGYRIGARESTRVFPLTVWGLAVGTMVGVSFILVFFLPEQVVSIQLIDALVRPALFLAAGLALATWVGPDSSGRAVMKKNVPPGAQQVLGAGFIAGLGSVFVILAVAAVVVAIALVLSFSTVIGLYEALQPGALGIVALSIAQLALLPTVIVWAATFLIGPGFTLGTGALVSALGTNLQAVPALPILGIVPQSPPGVGIAIVMIPVIIAFVTGFSLRERLMGSSRSLWADVNTTAFFSQPAVRVFSAAVVAALVAAGSGAFLAELVSGQMGPGRFQAVGPDPASIALWLGLEVGIGVFIGGLSGAVSRNLARSSR